MVNQKISSPDIDVLNLDARSFNALKRAGVNTIADVEAQSEQLENTISPQQWKKITNALSDYNGIPMPGSFVEENILGDELTFDEIAEMVGEIIILDHSTESMNWYKAVKVEDVFVSNDDHRHLRYFGGTKQCGIIDEMYFDKSQRSPQRAWRVKLQDKPAEPTAVLPGWAVFSPIPSCEMVSNEPLKLIGDKKQSISYTCNAGYAQDIYNPEDLDGVAQRCNNCENCEFFLVHKLKPVLKDEHVKINVSTPLSRLKDLYSIYNSPQSVPVPSGTGTPAVQEVTDFDYTELDSDTAKALKGCEAIIKQETSGYFTMLGAKFKEAQELLANHGKGTFERWYSSIGFKRQTVYNLIQRYEFSSSPTIGGHEEIFEALPVTLSYEISKPTAPSELVEQVMNGDITTHKEYIELKKQLDEAKEKAAFWNKANTATNEENQKLRAERVNAMNRADNAERELSEAQAEIEKLNREADEADREYDAMADRECHYETEICKLEQRIKELENKPVDVAVQTDDSLLKEKDQEISELKEQIERMSDKTVKSFVIRMSPDEYEQLIKALEQADDRLKNIIKNARILKI